MMATEVASLFATLGLRDQGFQRGMQNAQSELGGFASGMRRVGGQMQSFGLGLTAMTAPITAGLGAGLRAAGSFQTTMIELSVRTGATADEMARASDFALEMGAQTAFSGQQAAQALLELAAGGSSLEEAMAALPTVLDLAAAGSLGLGQAADIVTDNMAQFGVGVGDARSIADSLVQAAGNASGTVNDMAQALANVGPVARSYALDVADTAAVLATFAQTGITGAEAGTQLRSLLINLSRDTDGVNDAWDALGTSLYDADGNIRNLNTVLLEMDAALDQMPVQQQNQLMQELAGSYGIVGLTALRNAGGFGVMAEAMSESATAAEVAEEKNKGFQAALNRLMGSVDTLATEALTPLMDEVLTPFINDHMTPAINKIIDWTKENPELTKTIIAITGAAAMAGPVIMILGTVMSAAGTIIGAVTTGATLLKTAMLAMVTPIGAVTAAVLGLVAAYQSLQNYFDTIRPAAQAAAGTAGQAYLSGAVSAKEIREKAWAATVGQFGDGPLARAIFPHVLGELQKEMNANGAGIMLGTTGNLFGDMFGAPIGAVPGGGPVIQGPMIQDQAMQSGYGGGGSSFNLQGSNITIQANDPQQFGQELDALLNQGG